MNDKYSIISAKDAQRRSNNLKSIWSNESYLSQKITIYIATLLEEMLENTRKSKRKPRKPSAWNAFLSVQMKQGKSMKEAAALYREKK